jgi:DNA-binding NtrC family response regulator
MPALTGLELLARVKAQHPLTRRILLTGHTDLNDAVKAFNDVTISFHQQAVGHGRTAVRRQL